MKIINFYLLIVFIFIFTFYGSSNDKVQIEGNLLSVFNSLNQKDQPENQARRTQFDVAGNVDVTWKISDKITGAIQLQSSVGEGSLGFASNSARRDSM